jgi:hypothetical protein
MIPGLTVPVVMWVGNRRTGICDGRREIDLDQGDEVPQKLRLEFEDVGVHVDQTVLERESPIKKSGIICDRHDVIAELVLGHIHDDRSRGK